MNTLTISNIGPVLDAAIDLAAHVTILTGNNGSGKSTVLSVLAGMQTGDRQFFSDRNGEPYYLIKDLGAMLTTGMGIGSASFCEKNLVVTQQRCTLTPSQSQSEQKFFCSPFFERADIWTYSIFSRKLQLLVDVLPQHLSPVPTAIVLAKALREVGVPEETITATSHLGSVVALETRFTALRQEVSAKWRQVTQVTTYPTVSAVHWLPACGSVCKTPTAELELRIKETKEAYIHAVQVTAVSEYSRQELEAFIATPLGDSLELKLTELAHRLAQHQPTRPVEPTPNGINTLAELPPPPTFNEPRHYQPELPPPQPPPLPSRDTPTTVCPFCGCRIEEHDYGAMETQWAQVTAQHEETVAGIVARNKAAETAWVARCSLEKKSHAAAISDWEVRCAQINNDNDTLTREYKNRTAQYNQDRELYLADLATWRVTDASIKNDIEENQHLHAEWMRRKARKEEAVKKLPLLSATSFTAEQVREFQAATVKAEEALRGAKLYAEAQRLCNLYTVYDAAKKLLSPNGLQKQLLHVAISEINVGMAWLSSTASWSSKVELTPDLNLTVDGHSRLSGGMQLMANLCLQLVIGELYSKEPSPFILIDELDRLKGDALRSVWLMLASVRSQCVVTFAGELTEEHVPIGNVNCYKIADGKAELVWRK